MNVDIWSDIVCPFCYIGKRRLENALAAFPHKEHVTINFKSFELDPNAPLYEGKTYAELLAKKYGMSEAQVKEMTSTMTEQAAQVGLSFHFDDMKPTNTFDAHRLLKLAKSYGKEKDVKEELFYAFFTEGKDVGNRATLAGIAETVGIDRTEAEQMLADELQFANAVRADEREAQSYGVSGVPYFIFNNKYTVSGAQPEETFAGALQKVWEEEQAKSQLQDLSAGDAGMCADGRCAVPEKDTQ
ncbi:DsbA family oxidoreductase [Bacillaceae bacterium SIJ1]|uniref:DsbA family oxidoreductase n=1 Tax=Litoribacterium kuwaitense TaxID=1398745 RepID=UPI0013E9F86D|nr:DsbA family oxidoreductase [Litoribacterium kuwaitense]NGP46813.1 DsbA family oxidoreductase [Litoribacterium kuwaitense]